MPRDLKLKSNTVSFLLGLNILMFVLTLMIGYIFEIDGVTTLILLGAENKDLIMDGQVWRMITSAFLHANIIHIIANMYYFTQLGGFVDRYFGGKKLLMAYVFTAVTASAGSLTANELGLQYSAISVGSSGAVFGLLGLVFVSSWKSQRNPFTLSLPLDYRQLIPYIIISLALGMLIPGVNNAAHIGGFIGGGLLALFINPDYGYVSGRETIIEKGFYYLSIFMLASSFLSLILSIIINFNKLI